jgi:integrase
MAERRAKGEGSIYRRADGKWVAQITFLGPDGIRKVLRKVRPSQGDARRELTTLKSKQDAHTLVVTGKATVRAWLDVWLESFIRPNRAPTTYIEYRRLLDHHVPPEIAKLPLEKLAAETLQRHFNAIAATGHGRTAELLRSVLRSSFNKAVKLRRMATNPVLGTDAIQYKRQATTPFTPEEAQRFLAAAANDRLGALFTIAVSLGLREGEVRGLKREDIDLETRIVRIRRSLGWIRLPGEERGRWVEREPKQHSAGDLPMTDTIYRALVWHLARRQEEANTSGWKDSGYLFTSVTGAPLHARNLLQAFHKLCETATVPKIRFHDTRHTAGTMLHCQGADPFVIQKVLRHSQLTTTRRYTHVPASLTKAALDRVDALYAAVPDGPQRDPAVEPVPEDTSTMKRVQ